MTTGYATLADITYAIGPESKVAEAVTILVGKVSGYTQQVTRQSPDAVKTPLEWTVSGELAQARALKGDLPHGPIKFQRAERSPMLAPELTDASWEEPYGNLTKDGPAVLFLGPGQTPPVLTIVPTGQGEEDLAGLVQHIVRFRALKTSEEKYAAWTGYLGQEKTVQGNRTALRALCHSGAKWERLEPPIGKVVADQQENPQVRDYAFGLVAYCVVRERWGAKTQDAVDFLCDVFSDEADPDLTMDYLVSLSVILDSCYDEDARKERKPIRDRIQKCLKQRKKLEVKGGPPVDDEMEADYQDDREEMLAGPPTDIPADEP